VTHNQILILFREQAAKMQTASPALNAIIQELAQLLADSRGKLSKENFESLVRIGGALYKEGQSRFDAKSDVDAIMKQSAEDHRNE
jgi:hypothetical protein